MRNSATSERAGTASRDGRCLWGLAQPAVARLGAEAV
jgi:hypothetical protein